MLLSSLESRASDLKAELGVEDKDSTGDRGDLDLQQFLTEIKMKTKSVFSQRKLMKVHYADATFSNDEEHFSLSIE